MGMYAIVKNKEVINIVMWDGESAWTPPSDNSTVLINADVIVDIGYQYDSETSSFTAASDATTL